MYKRQVTAVDGDGTSAVGEQMHPGHGGLPAAGAVMVRLLALIPVSYTHLDVYKRQVHQPGKAV